MRHNFPTPAPEAEAQGRADYEADCRSRPNYHDGRPRPTWANVGEIARYSWTRPRPAPEPDAATATDAAWNYDPRTQEQTP